MATRKSGPLDVLVGTRIRTFRVNRGMSQAVLAARTGVTYQQLQKFERGTERVGASRLSRIAVVLDISVGEFFESSETGSSDLGLPVRLLTEPGALRVLEAYARTTNPRVRRSLAKLVESIADRIPGAKATVARLEQSDLADRRRSPSQR
ncbi:helix-turn-helix domain-containing protein [Bradyrhizobium sp. BWA-3-5]|jgi:transcriptional regulator with XRE-family HTH domain|uniref:helix-turn-helix domain-containing protein n=1 Tax=Bradyrhizobium sp. BWA-3-5 TaxID=3080013 RepID=UPI00293E2A8B|nr:helix-turn-helix domain-containing protein [Bradyrhizobium sp. BWA-3-5]WOH65427.1 helix-turn-helix domain-containing protein [Bradyrhizobium sp. BWA-3-5]